MVRRERTNTATISFMTDIESVESVRAPQGDAVNMELRRLFDPILSEPIPESMRQILRAR